MLRKFLPSWEFLWPLAAHCAVHAAFTLLILIAFARLDLWYLAVVDFVIHFLMDRIKAGPKYLGRFKSLAPSEYVQLMEGLALLEKEEKTGVHTTQTIRDIYSQRKRIHNRLLGNKLFWWSLGLDQMVHHLTHYYIIYKMVVS